MTTRLFRGITVAAGILALGLTACSGDPTPTTAPTSGSTQPATAPTTTAPETQAPVTTPLTELVLTGKVGDYNFEKIPAVDLEGFGKMKVPGGYEVQPASCRTAGGEIKGKMAGAVSVNPTTFESAAVVLYEDAPSVAVLRKYMTDCPAVKVLKDGKLLSQSETTVVAAPSIAGASDVFAHEQVSSSTIAIAGSTPAPPSKMAGIAGTVRGIGVMTSAKDLATAQQLFELQVAKING